MFYCERELLKNPHPTPPPHPNQIMQRMAMKPAQGTVNKIFLFFDELKFNYCTKKQCITVSLKIMSVISHPPTVIRQEMIDICLFQATLQLPMVKYSGNSKATTYKYLLLAFSNYVLVRA